MSLIGELSNIRGVRTHGDHPTLGEILRDLRNHRGWTLKEMSEESEVRFTLSKVEHDRLTLTYDKLLQLAKLNNPMSELFAESEPGEEGVTARRTSAGRMI